MTNDGELNAANTLSNIAQDVVGKKARNKKMNAANKRKEVLLVVESSRDLTSHEPFSTEESEDEVGVPPKDVSLGKEWIMKVNAGMDAVEIFGRRLGKVEGTFHVLDGNAIEDIESIRNDLEGHTQAEIEVRPTITTLECILIEALSTIDSMNAKVEALEEQAEAGMTEAARNVVVIREAKIKASKPPVFHGVHDAQEVENFLWHLENYFEHGKVRDAEAKINTVVLYLSEIAMLW